MRTPKQLIILVLLTCIVTSCVTSGGQGETSAPTKAKIVGSDANNAVDSQSLQGFDGIKAMLERTTTNEVTRYIATDNGSNCVAVTIHYTDMNPQGGFDPHSLLLVVDNLAKSLSLLTPQTFTGDAPPSLATLTNLLDLAKLDTTDWEPLSANSLLQLARKPSGFQEKLNQLGGLAQLPSDIANNVQDLLGMLQKFQSLTTTNFQSALNEHLRDLLEDQLATSALMETNFLDINISLDAMLAAYLKAYLDGTFVDRWGNTLSQPDMTRLGSDTAVPATKVVLEAIFDYAMMTPIIHDSASTNKTPTFAVLFPQLYEEISDKPDAPGITAPENEAINYLSGLSGDGAKHVSSLIVKTLGGASFGAKISTGDNSTLSEIISTFNDELFRRNTEEVTYDLLEKFQYFPTNNGAFGYMPDIQNNTAQLDKTNNLQFGQLDFIFKPEVAQWSIVYALITQDDLKALSQGGWKFTGANVTNYETLASQLAGTNKLAGQIFNELSLTAQAVVKSGESLNVNQKQALTSSLNHLIGTNGLVYNPTDHPEINLSAETEMLLAQFKATVKPPKQLTRHVNLMLLRDALDNIIPSATASK
jgi:hypothetical protein